MVGRLAGRLVISGGRITTGTTPEAMEEEVACGGYMRGACEENNVQLTVCGKCGGWGTCGKRVWNMWGTCGVHEGNMWVIGMQTLNQLLLFTHQHRGRRRRQL